MIIAKHRLGSVELVDHEFTVPLNHSSGTGKNITVFARELVDAKRTGENLPWLLYFQGGPGIQAPRISDNSGKWWTRALKEYRVLLLDQRGTGRSTPLNHQSLAGFSDPHQQADYLKLFRADSIVRDAEIIRKQLVGEASQWSILGQSFGGFCAVTYLSFFPESLNEAIITGGIPPIQQTPDDVYRATYKRVEQRNREFYDRYPEDEHIVREIVSYLQENEVRLPGGDLLTPRRFQTAGLVLGSSSAFEDLHHLLEFAFIKGKNGHEMNYSFLRAFENVTGFDTNPLYALLHEPIYCEGQASKWSAERVLNEFPQFQPDPSRTVLFTGEMVYSWMFDEYEVLQPLKPAADILAHYDRWPALYDLEVLESNPVPTVAAVYYDDMYVERAYSESAAEHIRGIRLWITNEYQHNGIRADGERILDRLLTILRDG